MMRALSVLLASLLLLAPWTVSADQPESAVLRFGVVDVAPLSFMADGQPQGLFIDLVRDIAGQHGWRLEFEPVSWNEGLDRLAAGELDLLPTVAYSAARDSVLDYGAEPVTTLWTQVYLQPASPVQSVLDLAGRPVAVMRGDINASHFRDFCDRFGVEPQLRQFASLADAFAAVRDGEAAAAVAPNLFGHENAGRYGLVPSAIIFSPFPVFFATTAGHHADALAAIDTSLRQWRADRRSLYYRSLDAWLGQGPTAPGTPRWVPAVLVGLAGLAVLLVLWNRTLERRVRGRTRELALSEQRFRAVFESAGDVIFLVRDGRFAQCNPRALEQFRCQRHEIIGRRPEEFSPPEQPNGRSSDEAAHERIAAAIAGGPVRFEWRHRRLDGTLFDAEVTLNAFDVEGERYLQAFVRDITRRKRLEASLRQAQKMEAIGTLAGGIAHDFNNILSAIMGYNELARLEAGDAPQLASYLEQIGRAAERARNLVLQILAFSRQSGETKQPMDLAPVVDETLKLLRSSIPVTIEIRELIETPGRILADPTSMHQVVMNLCTNAFQAMADGGVLEVRLTERTSGGRDGAGELELIVTDTGPGMSADVLQKIFEPYFTTKSADRGTGLGLAVVHGIVEEHGGRIEVESSPGLGTTFRVMLPRCSTPPATADAPPATAAAAGGEHVLFVDDEPDLVAVFEKGLSRLGYRVTAFRESDRALAALRDEPRGFDVLVTDMTMPRITGRDLIRAALELNPDLPVIMCTGFSDGLTLDVARSLGARDLIMKPVEVAHLAHRIRMVLAGRIST
ncbi:MAG: ATP-binding protein [Candidatus Krumholzibacteriia bacterium]